MFSAMSNICVNVRLTNVKTEISGDLPNLFRSIGLSLASNILSCNIKIYDHFINIPCFITNL